MDGMTRARHWRIASDLLAPISAGVRSELEIDSSYCVLTEQMKERLEVAKIHAMLASAPADVAGEQSVRDWGVTGAEAVAGMEEGAAALREAARTMARRAREQ